MKIRVIALGLLSFGLSAPLTASAQNIRVPAVSVSAPLGGLTGEIASQMAVYNAQNAPSVFVVTTPVRFLALGALGLQSQVVPAQIVPLLTAGVPVTVRHDRLVDLDAETGAMIASVPPFVSKGQKTTLRSLQDLIDWGKRFGLETSSTQP